MAQLRPERGRGRERGEAPPFSLSPPRRFIAPTSFSRAFRRAKSCRIPKTDERLFASCIVPNGKQINQIRDQRRDTVATWSFCLEDPRDTHSEQEEEEERDTSGLAVNACCSKQRHVPRASRRERVRVYRKSALFNAKRHDDSIRNSCVGLDRARRRQRENARLAASSPARRINGVGGVDAHVTTRESRRRGETYRVNGSTLEKSCARALGASVGFGYRGKE